MNIPYKETMLAIFEMRRKTNEEIRKKEFSKFLKRLKKEIYKEFKIRVSKADGLPFTLYINYHYTCGYGFRHLVTNDHIIDILFPFVEKGWRFTFDIKEYCTGCDLKIIVE
jgi:hypothetical protein